VQLLTAIVAATTADDVPAAISNPALPESATAAVTADQ
jgi:hypothetical protein